MKGSIISVVLTLTVLLSLFEHNNNLVVAADFSWESISLSSSQNNTDQHGSDGCIGLHCLIAVNNHETDLFMDQLTGSANNYEAINAVNKVQPHDCKVMIGAYKGSSCTNNISPQYKNIIQKQPCRPAIYRGKNVFSPGCPQNV